MKLVIFSTYFLPVVGGVQTYVNLLAGGLSEWGAAYAGNDHIDVTVVTETPGTKQDDAVFPYRVVRKPSLWALKKLIAESDLVHLAGPSLLPMLLAWLSGKPFTIEQHGYQAICPNGLLFLQPEKSGCPGYFKMRRYKRCIRCRRAEVGAAAGIRSLLLTFPRQWLCNRAAANIAITDHVNKRLGLNHSQTIYYGIKDSSSAVARVDSVDTSGSPLQIAYVGRLVAEKGLPLLLRAVRRLKDDAVCFRLLFIGDGPERLRLRSIAAELQIEDCVTFTGDLRNGDLDRAVQNISMIVMPSVWEETAGLAAIEQMMRGGVVIAADIGGLSEVVGRAGLKFPPHDWEALSVCMRALSANPNQRNALGSAARSRAQKAFSLERMIREHLKLFGEVAHRADPET